MNSEESILNQIMANNQKEVLVSVNIAEIISRLFENLNKREQEVLSSRFGLAGNNKETLEAIGKKHQLTRERIRQIETSSVAKIKKIQDADAVLAKIRQAISQIIEEHGGVIDKTYLFEILHYISKLNQVATSKEEHNRYADFLVTRIFSDNFDEITNSKYFNNFIKPKSYNTDHLDLVAEELLKKIEESKRLLSTEELIELAQTLSSLNEHKDKIATPDKLDLSKLLSEIINDFNDNVYQNRNIYNFLRLLSDLEINKFGRWGNVKWREVSPKTINDKIYLVLKNEGKPMYYGDIAKKIQNLGFDHKGVNIATTHNELILDDKYVLVGRGLYGLKEWGYKNGTVADVIASIIEEFGSPVLKEDIVKKVMDQRLVKQTTINLALMNKAKFRKLDGGYYELVK